MMANKFGATCYKCGKYVAPGAGVFERVSSVQRKKWPRLDIKTKWLTQHHECVRKYSSMTHYLYNPELAL